MGRIEDRPVDYDPKPTIRRPRDEFWKAVDGANLVGIREICFHGLREVVDGLVAAHETAIKIKIPAPFLSDDSPQVDADPPIDPLQLFHTSRDGLKWFPKRDFPSLSVEVDPRELKETTVLIQTTSDASTTFDGILIPETDLISIRFFPDGEVKGLIMAERVPFNDSQIFVVTRLLVNMNQSILNLQSVLRPQVQAATS